MKSREQILEQIRKQEESIQRYREENRNGIINRRTLDLNYNNCVSVIEILMWVLND